MQELKNAKEMFLQSIKSSFLTPLEQGLKSIKKLQASSLTSEQMLLVRSLEESLRTAHAHTENLAYLGEIKTKAFHLHATPFAPMESFEKLVSAFEKRAEEAGVDLLVYIDPNAPKEIVADERYLIQILENLMLNAITFTPSGGSVFVDIKTRHKSESCVTLDVAVTDTGRGVEKKKIKEYLQAFSSKKSSLGTGVSSSYYLLKEMGSQLKIASEINKGSRFSFSLDVQSSAETMFEAYPDIKIGILMDDRRNFAYAKLLYQYVISMGLSVVSIKDKNDENMKNCHGVFVFTELYDNVWWETLQHRFSQTRFIPAVLSSRTTLFKSLKSVETLLSLPALPSSMNHALKLIEKDVPKELTDAHVNDLHAIEKIAKQRKIEKIKILVVEDNPINSKLVKLILTRYNFEVEVADNGQIALDKCKQSHFNMILMDIDMPVMDGITATKLIKMYEKEEGLPETPIVALTSHDLAGERSEIIASGLDEHMPKPLNVTRLELMLEHYLGFKPEIIKN